MTVTHIIERLERLKSFEKCSYPIFITKEDSEVLDLAIKAIEAWESLREELKYELCKKVHEKDSYIPCSNQTTSCSYVGLSIYELNNIIDCVIDKHLSEVNE